MEASSQSSSQQLLWKDVEAEKQRKTRFHNYHWVALVLAVVFLVLAVCIFSLMYLWGPSLGKVYDHEYKAVVDGVETNSVMEIDPADLTEIFRMGNGSKEVVEVHDFKNGITGIRFAEHQRCYIRTQTKKLPTVAEAEADDGERMVDEAEAVQMEDSQVWVPAEEPVVNLDFLLDSKIWEICQQMPIHWIHPSPMTDAEAQDVDTPDAEVTGQRFTRDVLDHVPVNDYIKVFCKTNGSPLRAKQESVKESTGREACSKNKTHNNKKRRRKNMERHFWCKNYTYF
ncbi:tenomodulin isoform X1 [Xiphophorus couchianus]|uniref:tenomodulin isoform X1 n=1 Tax=Xiphophorus couchianus TaxID=32473 RepID=UPI001016F7B4|nr:tenomodulin isoform X1 [Xiphophorus couchianus]